MLDVALQFVYRCGNPLLEGAGVIQIHYEVEKSSQFDPVVMRPDDSLALFKKFSVLLKVIINIISYFYRKSQNYLKNIYLTGCCV
jgi:hypothetical protein